MSLRFRSEAELWPLVDRAFQRHSRDVRTIVPSATVEHVGATATPGSLTKGDLDLLVRVPPERFAVAREALRGRYEIDQPGNWTETFASFRLHEEGELPLGIQLVAAGSTVDGAFTLLGRLLRSRPDLVKRANGLKRRHEGGDPRAYGLEKRALLEELLRDHDPVRFGTGTWPWPGS